jgi:UDP-glucose 4-epimerase
VIVLVVGGAGYIGSASCAALLEDGHTVTVLDDLSTGHRAAVPDGARLVIGSSADTDLLDRLFSENRVDVVMDFAALIEAGESMTVPERYFRNNVANALSVVEAMLRHDVGRFVFSSSAAVYGDPRHVPVKEDSALEPTNAYGCSKLIFETMLHWMHRVHEMRVGVLRYFNAAGAVSADSGEDHRPESHLVPRVLQCALGRTKNVAIYGTDYDTLDGTCVRDYVHVADLASAHVLAMHALDSRPTLTYNLGNGSGFSVREVIDAARAVTDAPIPVVEQPRRPGDPAVLVANADAIRDEIGWQPRHAGLAEIVESAWLWHSRHPQGFPD